MAGVLPQGRSTLDGALIPFLGDIVDWASGDNMYRAELYFVSAPTAARRSRSRSGAPSSEGGARGRITLSSVIRL